MDVHRRNLMKGVLTGSTLLALGIPPAAIAGASPGTCGRCGCCLEAAVRTRNLLLAPALPLPLRLAAPLTHRRSGWKRRKKGYGALEVVKLKGGLLNEYEKVANLLETFRDTRWIAVMDDGSAAVFTELVRNAGGSLVLLGSHVSSRAITPGSQDVPGLRHVWAAASPAHAAGGILAARLVGGSAVFPLWRISFPPGRQRKRRNRPASSPASWPGGSMGRLPTWS